MRAFAAAILMFVSACASTVVAHDEALLVATYGIEANGCSLVPRYGSGVALEPDLIMTSAHTIAGAGTITVHNPHGGSQAAVVVGFDKDVDLALLRVDRPGESLPVRPAIAGETGWLLAFSIDEGNHAKPVTVTKRILVTIEDIYVEGKVQRRAIELAGDVVSGDSGGAVVGQDGAVIGIVYAASRARSIGFAVRDDEIDNVLAAVSPIPISAGRCVP